jgi:hypothetical protein
MRHGIVLASRVSSLWKKRFRTRIRLVSTDVQLFGPHDSKKRAAIIRSYNDLKPGESLNQYVVRSKAEISHTLADIVLKQGERAGFLLSTVATVYSPAGDGRYQPNPDTHCLASFFTVEEDGKVEFNAETIVDFYSTASAPKDKKDIKHQGIVLKGQNYTAPGVHGENEARIFRFVSDIGRSMDQNMAPLFSIVLPANLLRINLEEIKRIVADSRNNKELAKYDRMTNSCAHKINELAPDLAGGRKQGLLPIIAMTSVARNICNCEAIADMILDRMFPYLCSPAKLYEIMIASLNNNETRFPKP